jgi:uncharacterized protein YbaP (TraB family)
MAACLLVACHKPAPAPLPARVALWEISDTSGPRGWMLGTVHALPAGLAWRRPAIDHALAASDRLVLEIAQPLDGNVAGVALARLAYTPGLPPPSRRVAMKYRDALAKAYKTLHLTDAQFENEESWAVALQIAAIGGQKDGMDPASGVEPQLRKLIGDKPVEGLETLDGQFGIFDRSRPAPSRPCSNRSRWKPPTNATTTPTWSSSGCAATIWASRAKARPVSSPTPNSIRPC